MASPVEDVVDQPAQCDDALAQAGDTSPLTWRQRAEHLDELAHPRPA